MSGSVAASRSGCASSTSPTRRSGASATIEGTALKCDAKLGVVAIEPLGRAMPLYDITTGTGDFIANGVVSHNCFARPTHTYLDLDAGEDFEREIVVKVNAARGAAGRAGAAVVEGRARRHGHQHRPLPVGRGALPAHGGHLGGAAGRRQPGLDPHQVTARAARHGAAAGAGRARGRVGRVLRSRPSTRRPGGRPSRIRRTRANGSRRWRSSTGPASPPACSSRR